jgi:ubiquinol-cytochrome c reductase cytochrome c1 subunit
MNKLIAAFVLTPVLALAPVLGSASENVTLDDAGIDLTDKASLQSGAKSFVNYCMGCHSLKYMRWNRMAQDLGIDDADLRQNYLIGNAKPGDLMTIAMRPQDGEKWFGTEVPDLTLVARWRSPDWVYTYLKSFYVDPTRPYGVNNVIFPNVGMPNVLQGLQGTQDAVFGEHHGEGAAAITGVKLVEPGSMSPEQYDAMVRDITAFLTYAGEPMQLERQHLGIYVMAFLVVLFVLAYLMKKEFWKDVH